MFTFVFKGSLNIRSHVQRACLTCPGFTLISNFPFSISNDGVDVVNTFPFGSDTSSSPQADCFFTVLSGKHHQQN